MSESGIMTLGAAYRRRTSSDREGNTSDLMGNSIEYS